ncbi:RNA-guided pseudouridylation complex pseudouridine synthase subunit Cbf5 [Candidatus Woesearchaeota archaeon]|nr:RNA-guided pseudouridylation complex pseudouridine synthase subunit Cbf5 [Candidatus Woesearchaeota archaeon]
MEKSLSLLPFEKTKREVFVRKDAETSDKFGEYPAKRSTEALINYGIVNIDKPRGPTSHQVSYYVQKILGIDKSGHSGTLDPNVTGILAIAVGNATKIVQALLTAGKEYVCLMHIHKDIDEAKVREAIMLFVGKIRQLPPIKSAVKRELRYRKIYYLEVMEIDGKDVLFKVGCQAGTYIRKLVHDIGQKLGCGAHMVELRRTKAGPFNESTELCTLQDLSDARYYYKEEKNDKYLRKLIQPIEKGVEHLAKVWVLDTSVNSLCNGASLKVPGVSKVESDIQTGDPVAIMTLKDELIGFGRAEIISREMQKQNKGIAVKMQRIFMQPGIYPKIEKKNE